MCVISFNLPELLKTIEKSIKKKDFIDASIGKG